MSPRAKKHPYPAATSFVSTPPHDGESVDIAGTEVSGRAQPTNAQIAQMLRDVADILELEGANTFRVRAYRSAANAVEEYASTVAALAAEGEARLHEVRGVGTSLAHRIVQFVRTGHIPPLDDPDRRPLAGAAELLRVPGIGRTRARMLAQRFGIRTLDDLATRARSGQLREVPGFGERSEERILRDIAAIERESTRTLRAQAVPIADALLASVARFPGVRRVAIAGDVRRAQDSVAGIDLVCGTNDPEAVMRAFELQSSVRHIHARSPNTAIVELRTGMVARLHITAPEAFGVTLFCDTGSAEHTAAVRARARGLGARVNPNGIFRRRERIAGANEEDVYFAAGLPFIPPELREGRGEIEAARDGRLPELVRLDDVRGEVQCHSDDSDGRAPLERMAEAAESLGYEYVAITDHSPALRVVQGLDAAGFRRQWERIDAVNGQLARCTVLKGPEVDILDDGSLDLDDDTLAGFDLVLVSIHSLLALSAPEQTRRLVRALSHPAADIWAHPTARILLRRPPVSFDVDEVMRAAADNGVMLEVNGQPDRLDLDDRLVQTALERGVRLVLGTDAHAVRHLQFMRWAVDQARRGWARKADVGNTRPLSEFRALLKPRRRSA